MPHDELVSFARDHTDALASALWDREDGAHSWPKPYKAMTAFSEPYRIAPMRVLPHRLRRTTENITLHDCACIEYIACMPTTEPVTTTLTIRNVDRRIKERLRIRAAQHGQSMEAELRQILRDALDETSVPEPNLAEAIRQRFAALGGVELEPHPPSWVKEPPSVEP